MRFFVSILFSSLILLGHTVWSSDQYASTNVSQLENRERLHGNQQVFRMLQDRPNMARYTTVSGLVKEVTPEDEIWKWAENAYNITINGSGIIWDKSDLTDKPNMYISDHDIPTSEKNGAIRVRLNKKDRSGSTTPLTFEELWNGCIFELINIRKAEKFMFAYNQVIESKMSREEYIRYNQEAEYTSLIELNKFFVKTWKPWAISKNIKFSEKLWEQDLPDSFEQWIAQFKGNNGYKYWEDYYDNEILPYLMSIKG